MRTTGIATHARWLQRGIFTLVLLSAGTSEAAFRAYLSADGNDANLCTLQSPCRLLPAALAAVNAGGEIWMLDSANYNVATVAIDKSVTILAIPGAMGSIVGNGGDAIAIATPGVKVALRNLTLTYITGMGHGINMTDGAGLVVDQCVIYGFGGNGITIVAPAAVVVIDSVVRNNGGTGIRIDRGANTTISRSQFLSNQGGGIWSVPTLAGVTAYTTVSDSVASGNGQGGVAASSNNGSTVMTVTRTVSSGNATDGFQVNNGGGSGGTTQMTISSSTASNNGRYGVVKFSGTIFSDGTSVASGNLSADVNGAMSAAAAF